MSKSLKRVLADAGARGLKIEAQRLDDGTKTAEAAAQAVGATADQIVKSVILRATDGGEHVLFLTAGGNYVDIDKAAAVAGIALEKADAASIRAATGFAIGGVSPFGHIAEIRAFFDPHILTFEKVWAAAGTPHHVFEIEAQTLLDATGATLADFT
ncbi:YbaK/EbsC family protein [Oceanibium sediminis]|uniref:YbaK/EbsC family protein n=1 Tax=Oceanibium sediminis TaxID=2026339 RepID=UPI000DD4E007|nr:YbaK/EbsC family protein [Oceanibium sediminis]